MALIPVEEAPTRILNNVKPLPAVTVKLEQALGRVLARPLKAVRNQPPSSLTRKGDLPHGQ